ncbi:helix-turn-helix domain-containing protein [Luteimicrobium xylanilyticum]|uniref:HTH araC/xylS-type domain-containing protein n=1 Tax=Luteimicrobium xylanilyticum TaxID=1133546 RepID=A0A5P9QBU1_9MICO|nr:AraC family transcriptional regulator [Luteimicrobium xylanilyticum]QFU98542.1 hypothetical protein KDY119_02058 [Luteimicrobium xylanilyticum]
MAVVLEIEDFPVTDRVEFLREHMLASPVPLVLEPRRGADLLVRSRVADLGCVHLLSTRAGGGDVVRSERLARDDTPPSLMVSLVEQGTTAVVRDDAETVVRPGEIGLYLTTEPYRLRFTDAALRHTFQIPLHDLGLPLPLVRAQLGRAIRPEGPVAAVVSAFLGATARNAPTAPPGERVRLEQPTLDLVRLLLTRSVADERPGRAASAASLGTRVEEHVRGHLDDPDLSARSVAAAFSISERYVYAILARRGIDLGDAVRTRRLERAARLLQDPRCVGWTIAAVALRCGFADHAHFSRAFRAQFGVTPSEWRARRWA